jgi:hypothetical protein
MYSLEGIFASIRSLLIYKGEEGESSLPVEERYGLDWRMTREGQHANKVTGNIPFATCVRTGYKRGTQK